MQLTLSFLQMMIPRSIAAGLVLFCLDTKKDQKKSGQKKASTLQAKRLGPLFCQAFARI